MARWAGFPARIGFGFDGFTEESGVKVIRPRNAAQWLEIQVDELGWVPIVTKPPRAKADLSDKDTRNDPNILPTDDVATELLIPFKVVTVKQLYEQVRAVLVLFAPFVLLILLLYLCAPSVERAVRRSRRRRWASSAGRDAQILVEYTELRDLATDLGVGHPTKTAIEFLDLVDEDVEHQELAWLVTRSLYGDMAGGLQPNDVVAASELSASIRRRLRRGQPMQSRVLAFITRLSLYEPYTREVPATRARRAAHERGLHRRLLRRVGRPLTPIIVALRSVRRRSAHLTGRA
jgi:hypothetical protein